MPYNGIEVDVLSLGDADSILITRWENGQPERVLVDGGNKGQSDTVLGFLDMHKVKYVDHIVCTHMHDDHAGGLIKIVQQLNYSSVWMHLPKKHMDASSIINKEKRIKFEESVVTADTLEAVVRRRGKLIIEPFQGSKIGFLTVCGPTINYYKMQLKAKVDEVKNASYVLTEWLMDLELTDESKVLVENPPSDPENNCSLILATQYRDTKICLTGDAGVDALRQAMKYPLNNCTWFQIPHHGSRKSLSPSLIKHINPRIAFVSAEGNVKHPRRAVVNALKKLGTIVLSTHYPDSAHLWMYCGLVPSRDGYGDAIPLYET